MKQPRSNRVIFLLFLMFFYIVAQLGWWAYLITHLTSIVYANDPRLEHRVMMVLGEGMVFAILLLLGFLFTYRSYRKEIELARQQRNFLLSVTHEFKTPIASLRLMLETISKRQMPEEKRMELIQKALQDTDRLNALSENILQATRIDQRVFSVHRSVQDFSFFVRQTLEHLSPLIGRDHHLDVLVEENISYDFDAGAMHSILANLVENAVKYSPKGSTIQVVLSKSAGRIQLDVIDQGKGIPEANKKRIFEKFYRAGNEETRSAKGTGLGLYIVHYFVRLHGGMIQVLDHPKGGSVFRLMF